MAKKHAAKTAAAPETTGDATPEVNETQTPETQTPETQTPETQTPETPAPAAEKPVPLAKLRGPRGVPETAKITLVSQVNPKRAGSKAHAAFACYADGMTVGAFCDEVDKLVVDGKSQKGMGTPHLVYDTAHGFIKIEGYNPPGGVVTPKPKAPPKPKAEKPAKASGPKEAAAPSAAAEELASNAGAVEAATAEEVID